MPFQIPLSMVLRLGAPLQDDGPFVWSDILSGLCQLRPQKDRTRERKELRLEAVDFLRRDSCSTIEEASHLIMSVKKM